MPDLISKSFNMPSNLYGALRSPDLAQALSRAVYVPMFGVVSVSSEGGMDNMRFMISWARRAPYPDRVGASAQAHMVELKASRVGGGSCSADASRVEAVSATLDR